MPEHTATERVHVSETAEPAPARDTSVIVKDEEGVTEGRPWVFLWVPLCAIILFFLGWLLWPAPPPDPAEVARAKAEARAAAEVEARFHSLSPVIDSFGASPKSGELGLTVTFTVEVHTNDVAAWPLTAAFNFGDHTGEFNAGAQPKNPTAPVSGEKARIQYTHTYRSIGFHPVTLRVADARRRVTRWEGDPIVISVNRPPDGGTGMESGARASSYTIGGDFLGFLGEVVGGTGRALERALGDGEAVPPPPSPGAIVLTGPQGSPTEVVRVFEGPEAIKATNVNGQWFGPLYFVGKITADDYPKSIPGKTIEIARKTEEKGMVLTEQAKAENLTFRTTESYLRVIPANIPCYNPAVGHAVVVRIRPLTTP